MAPQCGIAVLVLYATLTTVSGPAISRTARGPSETSGPHSGEGGYSRQPVPQVIPQFDVDRGGYVPSGWMGDGEGGRACLQVEPASGDGPHSPPHSQKWVYRPGRLGWTAVAWQYPEANWGDRPGMNLNRKGFTTVSVWARGVPDRKGRYPVVQFKAGGHTAPKKKYQASFEVEGDFLVLTAGWKEYTLNIKGEDLSNVICGFAFVVRAKDNPEGATFYLDDIAYK